MTTHLPRHLHIETGVFNVGVSLSFQVPITNVTNDVITFSVEDAYIRVHISNVIRISGGDLIISCIRWKNERIDVVWSIRHFSILFAEADDNYI